MLQAQKTLLSDIQTVTDDALKILNQGVKISGVVQKLRAAGKELETRVKYLEAETPKPAKRKNAKKDAGAGDSNPPSGESEIENPKS